MVVWKSYVTLTKISDAVWPWKILRREENIFSLEWTYKYSKLAEFETPIDQIHSSFFPPIIKHNCLMGFYSIMVVGPLFYEKNTSKGSATYYLIREILPHSKKLLFNLFSKVNTWRKTFSYKMESLHTLLCEPSNQ